MTVLLILIGLLAILASGILYFVKKHRAKAKYVALSGIILVVVGFQFTNRNSDLEAQRNGFADRHEMREATKSGLNAEQWKASNEKAATEKQEQETLKARAAEELARRRQPPADQMRFIEVIQSGQRGFKEATTDFLKGATRPARSKAICQVLKSTQIGNWVGTVSGLTTNGDGKGVLRLRLAEGVTVGTWNNSLSDIGTDSLVEPGTKVFEQLGALKPRDIVRFSGRFTQGDTDCIGEQSISLGGSMREPVFTVVFSEVTPIN